MPVETVDVVQRQHVDETADAVRGHIVARYIEVRAAVAEARSIVHLHCRNGHLLQYTRFFKSPDAHHVRHGLAKGLDAVECSGIASAADGDAVFPYLQGIAFGIVERGTAEGNEIAGRCLGDNLEFHAGTFLDELLQESRIASARLVLFGDDDGRSCHREVVRMVLVDNLLGTRHDVEVGGLCAAAGSRAEGGQSEHGFQNVFFHGIFIGFVAKIRKNSAIYVSCTHKMRPKGCCILLFYVNRRQKMVENAAKRTAPFG